MRYSRSLGRYETDSGNPIARAIILNEMERQAVVLRASLERLVTELLDGQISLADWETRSLIEIKNAAIRMTGLAAGGMDGIGASHLQILSSHVTFQSERLSRLRDQLINGELSEAQFRYRMSLFARSARSIFFRQQHDTRVNYEQFNEARRRLDPQSEHCPECIRYQTRDWVPSFQVVPQAVECSCSNNCRCAVNYRRNPSAAINNLLQPLALFSRVLRSSG